MITTKILKSEISKVSEHNYIVNVDVEILKSGIEIDTRQISIPFYEYCAENLKEYIKNKIEGEVLKIKKDFDDTESMTTKIGALHAISK